MGASLYTSLYPNDKPNVALLNIGSEELKGNETIKETYQLLNQKNQIIIILRDTLKATILWMEKLM